MWMAVCALHGCACLRQKSNCARGGRPGVQDNRIKRVRRFEEENFCARKETPAAGSTSNVLCRKHRRNGLTQRSRRAQREFAQQPSRPLRPLREAFSDARASFLQSMLEMERTLGHLCVRVSQDVRRSLPEMGKRGQAPAVQSLAARTRCHSNRTLSPSCRE